jgi:putative DNA modification/repair radical SAM protein
MGASGINAERKLTLLGGAAKFDACSISCAPGAVRGPRVRSKVPAGVCTAVLPDGRSIRLLKVLQSNVCTHDCLYCANRVSRDVRRTTLSPEELARTFIDLHAARQVQGLFLSSGIHGSAERAMERMLATAELLRLKHHYTGYMHLKVLPGASVAAVERAVRLADRTSVNLEAPTAEHLARIAPGKDLHAGIIERMKWVAHFRTDRQVLRAGMTTQFVVGAAGERDRDLIQTSALLYRTVRLNRAYYSAFVPVGETPLEGVPATSLRREHRLYQADWLLRFYGFSADELIFDATGNLSREADPKQVWAAAHPEFFPVEVNTAERAALLRVPGIGPRSARRILNARRDAPLRRLADLGRLGVIVKRAHTYLTLAGRRCAERQPALF